MSEKSTKIDEGTKRHSEFGKPPLPLGVGVGFQLLTEGGVGGGSVAKQKSRLYFLRQPGCFFSDTGFRSPGEIVNPCSWGLGLTS